MSKNFVIEVMVSDNVTTSSLIQLKSKIIQNLPKFRKHVIDINLVDEQQYLKSKAGDLPGMKGYRLIPESALKRWQNALFQTEERDEIERILTQ